MESGAIFDFQKELSSYLRSDVEVLDGSLSAFSEEMVALTGIGPVTQCVTIASTAFLVWRKMFLESNLIALEPQKEENQVNQCKEAIEWLEYENFKKGGGIQVCKKLRSVKSLHFKKLKLQCFSTIKKLRNEFYCAC